MNDQGLKLMASLVEDAKSKLNLLTILRDEVAGAYEISKDPDLASDVNSQLRTVYQHMNQILEAQIEHVELLMKIGKIGKLLQSSNDSEAVEKALKGLAD